MSATTAARGRVGVLVDVELRPGRRAAVRRTARRRAARHAAVATAVVGGHWLTDDRSGRRPRRRDRAGPRPRPASRRGRRPRASASREYSTTCTERRNARTERPEEWQAQPAGGQHVVGAGAVVAERHRRVRADEDRAGVADPGGVGRRVGGLDLEVLGGVGVDHVEALLEVVDEHDARTARPVSAVRIRSTCRVAATCLSSSASTSSASAQRVGDQHGGGHRVVLGLADQVGRDVRRVGGVVGEDRDLGRPGLGVDADDALEQPLGGDGVDVARPGDQVDRAARPRRRTRTSRPPARRRRRTPRRRRAARTPPGSSGAAVRRGRSGASWSARSSRRRRPAPARRSSPRWRPAGRCRRARRGRPGRSGPAAG